MSFTKSDSSFKVIFIEIFSIVLGISLAFLANDWRENSNSQKRALTALASINNELKVNRENFNTYIPNHELLKNALTDFISGKPDSGTKKIKNKKYPSKIALINFFVELDGFRDSPVLSAAWESAVSLNVIELFDYEILHRLSEIDGSHKRLNEIYKAFYRLIYGKDAFKADEVKPMAGALLIIINDIINSKTGLLGEYEKVIKLIDEKTKE